MDQNAKKQAAAAAALESIKLEGFIGIGTGSTANCFIDLLAQHRHDFEGAVASSDASADRLRAHGIPVLELNGVGTLAYYVDGADEATRHGHLLKGGGGALTREKSSPRRVRHLCVLLTTRKSLIGSAAFPYRWKLFRWPAATSRGNS